MVTLTDRPNVTLDAYRGRKTKILQHHGFGSNKGFQLFFKENIENYSCF